MVLPRVRNTSVEVTNPQFRIIEKTDPSDGMTFFYPQRKLFGLFWIAIKTYGQTIRNPFTPTGFSTIIGIRHGTMNEAVAAIDTYKLGERKKKKKYFIHYL